MPTSERAVRERSRSPRARGLDSHADRGRLLLRRSSCSLASGRWSCASSCSWHRSRVAALSVATIVRIAPKSAELRAWSAMGLCVAALWFSEAYFSAYQVYVSPAGPACAICLRRAQPDRRRCALLSRWRSRLGSSRLPRATLFVFVSDLVSMSAIVFAAVYAFWMRSARDPRHHVADGGSLGRLLVRRHRDRSQGVAWLARGSRSSTDSDIVSSAGGGTCSSSRPGSSCGRCGRRGMSAPRPPCWMRSSASLVLIGYCMMMMAALMRLARADRGWRITMGRSIDMSRMWQSSLVSAVVLAASAVMGYCGLPPAGGRRGASDVSSPEPASRSWRLWREPVSRRYETGTLRDTSSIDPVTGALNHRAFQDECDERILASRRRGVPFVLVVLDLDGFSRVNSHARPCRGRRGAARCRGCAAVGRGALGERLSAFRRRVRGHRRRRDGRRVHGVRRRAARCGSRAWSRPRG